VGIVWQLHTRKGDCMYNFALAFTICAIFYIAGEWVDKLTHAWVPSVFVTAILMLLGYWFVLPYNLITDSVLLPFGATLGLCFCCWSIWGPCSA
jgi:hypothetical protein